MPGEENQNYLRQRMTPETRERARRAARIIPGVGAAQDAEAARVEAARRAERERSRQGAIQRNRRFNQTDPNANVRRNAIIRRLQEQRAAQRQPPLSQRELETALSEYGF